MFRNTIMEKLVNKGYVVEAYDKNNNGVVFKGIVNKTSNVCPIVYINAFEDDIREGKTSIEEIVDYIESVFRRKTPRINLDEILDPQYILNHIYMGLQKESEDMSDDKLIKRKCEFSGIEVYMYVDIGEGSFKITTNGLKKLSVPVEEMWRRAEKNTGNNTEVKMLSDIVCDIMGLDRKDFPKLDPTEEYYVFSNAEKFRGAAGVLDKGLIEKLRDGIGVSRFIMIPSSIHEVMLKPWPYGVWVDLEGLDEMVREVNEESVKPEDRLADEVFVIEI